MDSKILSRTAILILAAAFILAFISCRQRNISPLSGDDLPGFIMHDGLKRTYWLHVGPQFHGQSPMPLLLVLHGGGGSGAKMAAFTGFNRLADRQGFMVVYPDGIEKHWNDGRALVRYRTQRENIDDVGFLSSLIDTLIKGYPVDSGRIYVTGVSNGALMSYRLACEMADGITAIAAVIGAMGENMTHICHPTQPIPVLIIGGRDDPLVPWQGGDVHFFRRKLGRVISFPQTLAFWATHNGCQETPQIFWLPDVDPHDGTRIKRTSYRRCRQSVEVILYEIRGGGHTWPSGPQYLPEFIVGKTSRDMDGAKVIWNFLKQFRR
jgi:polyhydroxybutyrate depolymerase